EQHLLARIVASRCEDFGQSDVRLPAVSGPHRVQKLEGARGAARRFAMTTQQHEGAGLGDRELRVFSLKQLATETLPSSIQKLEGKTRRTPPKNRLPPARIPPGLRPGGGDRGKPVSGCPGRPDDARE